MLIEDEGKVPLVEEGEHHLDRVKGGFVPAIDHPVRAVDDGLRVAKVSGEEAHPADEEAGEGLPVLARGPAVPAELRVEGPVPSPLRAELRGGLIVQAEGHVFPQAEGVEAPGVEEGRAGVGVEDRERNGEGELDGVPSIDEIAWDEWILIKGILDEVVDQGEEEAVEGLLGGAEVGLAVEVDKVHEPLGNGIVGGEVALVVGSAGALQPRSEGPAGG